MSTILSEALAFGLAFALIIMTLAFIGHQVYKSGASYRK